MEEQSPFKKDARPDIIFGRNPTTVCSQSLRAVVQSSRAKAEDRSSSRGGRFELFLLHPKKKKF